VFARIARYFSLIKFSHTVFALPFAMIGFCLALRSGHATFTPMKLVLVLACMVLARSAAMAFNRYIDRSFDALNPRTAVREIPSGVISARSALVLVIACSLAFIACTWFINPLCFALSFVALAVILGYSYMKRITPLCHLVLGAGLALAPIGAYIALTERFDILPLYYSVIVMLWVSGFDIIYALQDDAFDRSQNLKSIPVLMGRKPALMLSRFFHFLAGTLVVFTFAAGGFGWIYAVGALVFLFFLVYQHTLVKPDDLSRVTLAFATTNGIASVLFGALACTDILLGRTG
jgi:4-hydroxybenzoate polyprenyltransferase